jgi:yeast amino acid transporter
MAEYDQEKALDKESYDGSPHRAENDLAPQQTYEGKALPAYEKRPGFKGFLDSFKRKPGAHVAGGAPGEGPPPEQLSRRLKSRHLQMIAIGGSIGTGLFVGSGSALAGGGPASLIIAFGLIGIMLYCTVHALGEMAVAFPVAGSFATYSSRFLDPAWGFAMGWNYALQWLVTLPLEIVAASITISFWPGAKSVNGAAWVSIFLGKFCFSYLATGIEQEKWDEKAQCWRYRGGERND